MRRAVGIIQIVLSLVLLSVMVVSCEESNSTPSTSTSTDSTYPAYIRGHVIIPESLYARGVTIWKSEGESTVLWVVEIYIENISYEDAITYYYDDYKDWKIVAGGEVYSLSEGFMSSLRYKEVSDKDDIEIPGGQTGNITFCFSVPDSLDVSDATLCYQGQEPYSYGKLTGGELVELYDWNSRTIAQ
jgi:hypothetical protein